MVLIDRIKTLAICGDDERRAIWLWTKRGTIDDFGDFNEYLEWGDVENHEEFYDLWRGYYLSELKWYKITFTSYKSIHYIYLDGKLVFQITNEPQQDCLVDSSTLATWLTNAVDKLLFLWMQVRNQHTCYHQYTPMYHKPCQKV